MEYDPRSDHRGAVRVRFRARPLIAGLRALFRGAADAIWPPVCPVCMGALDESGVACAECHDRVRPLGGLRCGVCSAGVSAPGENCPACATIPDGIVARVIACEYERIRPWVIAYKYRRRVVVGPILARAFADIVAERVQAFSPDAVMPVPIHTRRRRERGFNQSDLLASELATRLGFETTYGALVRNRQTQPQARLSSREDRESNVRGAFRVGDGVELEGRVIVLVDDVVTTGATVRECAEALLSAGAAKVIVCALAHPFLTHDRDVDVDEYDL